jgi:2-polyprenyl-3-methyl-5-hydroxy-6-metoxy-1,4-benzoquinol methylase
MTSIFARAPETYREHPGLLDAIRADPLSPLHQIADLIGGGCVLDVGCGAGLLGRLLAMKSGIVVDGLDPAISPDNAGVHAYRRFYQRGIESFADDGLLGQYDWFVFADVIEHLAFPDEMLARVVAEAKPEARFLISTPNVAHLAVRLDVLAGRFEYTKSGTLESTHLRFFTLSTLQTFLAAVGLDIERGLCLNSSAYEDKARPLSSLRTALALSLISDASYPLAYQFLISARKRTDRDDRREPPVFQQVGPAGLGKIARAAWRDALKSILRVGSD